MADEAPPPVGVDGSARAPARANTAHVSSTQQPDSTDAVIAAPAGVGEATTRLNLGKQQKKKDKPRAASVNVADADTDPQLLRADSFGSAPTVTRHLPGDC